MRASGLASMAAILGGLAWVVSAGLGWEDEPEPTAYVAGGVLLVLCLAAGGYALVATAPLWLRGVLTVATPALGATVWEAVHKSVGPDHLVVVAGGAVLLVAGVVGLARRRARRTRPEPVVRGRRAAR